MLCRRFATTSVAALIALCACSPAPRESEAQRLIRQYFEENNAAARQGTQAQQVFLRRTQHPDYTSQTCELAGVTVDLDPAMPTLRPDPAFSPSGAPPRGQVWVIAVEVTVRHNDVVVGKQIGSQHVVVLDGRTYGFAPCPSTP